LFRGRDFTEADRRGAPEVAIVSDAAVRRYWPGVDPIGRQLRLTSGEVEGTYTIVGVARDARYFGVEDPEVRPMVYVPALARPSRSLSLLVESDDATALAGALRRVVRDLDPQLPFGAVESLERVVRQVFATQRFALALFAIFAITAMLLAAIGIYGVLSYLVRQRTHELGIRVALGASGGQLVGSIVGGAMRLALAGVALGVLGGLMLTRLIANLLFGVTPTDLPTFVGVGVLLALTAAFASLLPARRAARADPMLALRGEP
jgi:hypothetical protein